MLTLVFSSFAGDKECSRLCVVPCTKTFQSLFVVARSYLRPSAAVLYSSQAPFFSLFLHVLVYGKGERKRGLPKQETLNRIMLLYRYMTNTSCAYVRALYAKTLVHVASCVFYQLDALLMSIVPAYVSTCCRQQESTHFGQS